MRRALASITLGLALLWGQAAGAAIGTPVQLGVANITVAAAAISLSTTADAPAGSAIIGLANVTATILTITDSAGNSYTIPAKVLLGTQQLWLFHIDNPVDLPGPCTVTASMAVANTLVITSVGTCPSNVTFTTGMAVTGTTITAGTTIASGCTLSGGSGTCTTTGDAGTPGSETVTIASTINMTWTGGTSKGQLGALSVSGLLTSSALDINGTGNNTGTPGTTSSISTGTLAQAAEIVIGRVDTNGTTGAFTQASGFTGLTAIDASSGNNETSWAYQIVAATTTVTYAPSWTTSRTFATNVYSFKGAGGAAASGNGNCPLLGVC